jgi:membrane peptidoglycan carboxypeptidase
MWFHRSLEPPVRALATSNPSETAFMRHVAARGGANAGRPRADAWTALTAISPLLVAAVVKAEDPRFFDHHGADWEAVARAIRDAVRARRIIRGASTITQQLARNLYLTPARSIRRKLRELQLALSIERTVAKPRILELYLNVIEWGAGIWGCAAASAHYFGKTPRDLDLFESTFLASLIPAPRAAIAGRNAVRGQRLQFSLASLLFLSGLATGRECAVCVHRARQLHRLLSAGMPLLPALASSTDVNAAGDDVLLDDLAAELGLPRLDGADLLVSRCGAAQERAAIARLRARVGDGVLLQVARTNDYAPLRQCGFRPTGLGGGAHARSASSFVRG